MTNILRWLKNIYPWLTQKHRIGWATFKCQKEPYEILHYVAFKTKPLKVKSCKLYNNKYMFASTQITNTESFAVIAVLIVKLLSRKVLFINKKTMETVKK